VVVSRSTHTLWGLAAALVLLGAVTVASFLRARGARTIGDGEFFAQLLLDVFCWSGLMYFSGGANNPFISYYLVPVVISAAVLPWRFTWLVMAAALLTYSLLLYHHVPFPLFSPMAGHGHGTSAHTLGMWFNFLFSAALISSFVVRMAAQLRRQEERAMAAREERLRDEQIMAVAGLAAGTAHELGTPLNTMTILVDETLARDDLPADLRADQELLRQRLNACREILKRLTRAAESDGGTLPARAYLQRCIERWSNRRPGTPYRFHAPAQGAGPPLRGDITLTQALENLFNNAADTGATPVEITLDWDSERVYLKVRDHGPGFSREVLATQRGRAAQQRSAGLGLGLMLSRGAIERQGGTLVLGNVGGEQPGARVSVTLPAAQPPAIHPEPPATTAP